MVINANVTYLRDMCRVCNSDCDYVCYRFCGRDYGLMRSVIVLIVVVVLVIIVT